jgi:hypothetical protein
VLYARRLHDLDLRAHISPICPARAPVIETLFAITGIAWDFVEVASNEAAVVRNIAVLGGVGFAGIAHVVDFVVMGGCWIGCGFFVGDHRVPNGKFDLEYWLVGRHGCVTFGDLAVFFIVEKLSEKKGEAIWKTGRTEWAGYM